MDLEEEATNFLMMWAAAEGSVEAAREDKRRSDCFLLPLLLFLCLRREQLGEGDGSSLQLQDNMHAIETLHRPVPTRQQQRMGFFKFEDKYYCVHPLGHLRLDNF